jgi:hypothetical protein
VEQFFVDIYAHRELRSSDFSLKGKVDFSAFTIRIFDELTTAKRLLTTSAA